ncbi:MAG: NAD(P)H-dependent flavin oxidoreductase YrpB (nitropropane dioxygenase family) [Halieaceae bacterium]|jgi:NAD(P)H-dependent flavin oxidoreductase YrpB (nitropropane dioxygenase family)
MRFDNRVTRMTGVELPIVQAPMGWIARSQLASADSPEPYTQQLKAAGLKERYGDSAGS